MGACLRVVVVLAVLAVSRVAVAAEPQLFLPRSAALDPSVGGRRVGVVRERLVEINQAALDRVSGVIPPAGETLELNLFDDVMLRARIERLSKVPGGYSWVGRLEGEPLSDVVLASYDGVLTGSVVSPNGAYRISYDRRGPFVEEIDHSAFPENGCTRDAPAVASDVPAPAPAVTGADDGSTIDVLVVYTSAARAVAGGEAGIKSLVNTAITETNQGYANSQVVQRLRLAGTAEMGYTESGIATDLERVRIPADGHMDSVHSLRDTMGADLVVLIGEGYVAPAAGGACGIAYMMTGIRSDFGPWAFAVVDRTCATGYYSFGHEIGHNMGLNHARSDYKDSGGNPYTPTSGAATYSFGYKDPGNAFRTVMAYNCPVNCTRVLHFSNPTVNYNSKTTGIVDGDPSSAFNAKSLDDTRVTVSNWRTSIRPQAVWHSWFAVDTLETPYVGDFNGDKKADIITFTRQNPNAVGDVYVALSDGAKFGDNTKWHDWFAITTDETVVIGDYDGDGKDDIGTWLGKTTKQVYVARSLGSGMTPETVWLSSIGFDPTDVILAGDANGDGKDDLVCFARKLGKVLVALSDGSKFAAATEWHGFFAVSTYERPRVADVDGDGKADIVTFATDSPTAKGDVYVATSDGARFVDANKVPNSSSKWHDWFAVQPSEQVRIGDLDGDKKDDFFTFMPSPMAQSYTVRSQGTSMAENVLWYEAVAPLPSDTPYVGDANGDGKSDIVVFAQSEGKVYVSLGK